MQNVQRAGLPPGVTRCARCELRVTDRAWPFANEHAAAIDAHWLRATAASPALFDGRIHMLYAAELVDGAGGATFRAELLATGFRNYLYWRERGFPEIGVRDAFGSALLRSAEGHVVLGRQRQGYVNAGLTYLPGGFIDPSDVAADGFIDIDGSITREIAEETGLLASDFDVSPGYLLTNAGPLISIAREHRSKLPSETLRTRILDHIAADPAAELVEAVIVRGQPDLVDLAMPDFARLLLMWLFQQAADETCSAPT